MGRTLPKAPRPNLLVSGCSPSLLNRTSSIKTESRSAPIMRNTPVLRVVECHHGVRHGWIDESADDGGPRARTCDAGRSKHCRRNAELLIGVQPEQHLDAEVPA